MQMNITFDREFDAYYQSMVDDECGHMLLEMNGISPRLLDIGEQSHKYFTDAWEQKARIDHNANASTKCPNNYTSEIVKPLMKLEGLYLLHRYLRKTQSLAKTNSLITRVLDGTLYVHDMSGVGIQENYCYAFSTHWIIENGTPFGQLPSLPPKHARSFIGQVAEMVMSASQEFAGAIAPADVLVAYSYFAEKEGLSDQDIINDLQSFVHILNKEFRPGNQSAFTNISIFDRYGLESLFSDIVYPDGSTVDYTFVMHVQDIFLRWFTKGIPGKNEPYRFPVVTANFTKDSEGRIMDMKWFDVVMGYNTGLACLNIHSAESNKLASCCRLVNDVEMMRQFRVDSFGNGGLNIGSTHIVALNLPHAAYISKQSGDDILVVIDRMMEDAAIILDTHRNQIVRRRIEQGFYKLVECGLVDVGSLFSTFGFTGAPEMCKVIGFEPDHKDGVVLMKMVMDYMHTKSIEISKGYGYAFNVEEVPGESAAVTLRNIDVCMFGDEYAELIDTPLYSNQFIPSTYPTSLEGRILITGLLMGSVSGGAIMHVNLDECITDKDVMIQLCKYIIANGVEHFAINYGFSRCTEGHTCKGIIEKCHCGAGISQHLTRVVGYFVPVTSWNKVRREYDFRNRVRY